MQQNVHIYQRIVIFKLFLQCRSIFGGTMAAGAILEILRIAFFWLKMFYGSFPMVWYRFYDHLITLTTSKQLRSIVIQQSRLRNRWQNTLSSCHPMAGRAIHIAPDGRPRHPYHARWQAKPSLCTRWQATLSSRK